MKKYLKLLRPHHWIKNSFVFVALIFANKANNAELLILSCIAFVIFSIIASGIYTLNDIKDKEQDKLHPEKKLRPIASEQISTKTAWIITIMLLGLGLLWAKVYGTHFLSIMMSYIFLNILYSWKLKHYAFIDIIIIAIGFVLRVISGAIIINVPISNWLLICTFLLALFLAITKRRQELQRTIKNTRETLNVYSTELLDKISTVIVSLSLMSYILYTFNSTHTSKLIITIPIVFYGIFRYLYLVFEKNQGEDTVKMIIKDIPLQITCAIWIISILILLGYFA